ncbi:MAG: ribosome silencing factor [Sphaerochaetaceae bacterium]|nr:ribosome silencing factor [Sphaerochaetaceae bacterium]
MIDEKTTQIVSEIAQFITDHKGEDTVVMDVSEVSGWADCFIISTVNSVGHLKGVAKELWQFLNDRDVHVHNRHTNVLGDGWELIDCGDIVIHLMGRELREFYNLEKLWHTGKKIDFMEKINQTN